MKRFIYSIVLCFAVFAVLGQGTTNYFWSANYTSNYFRTNIPPGISNYIYQFSLTNNLARTNVAPFSTLLAGITTNVPVLVGTNGSGAVWTNWLCFTNGVLLRITNNIP